MKEVWEGVNLELEIRLEYQASILYFEFISYKSCGFSLRHLIKLQALRFDL